MFKICLFDTLDNVIPLHNWLTDSRYAGIARVPNNNINEKLLKS